MIITCEACSVSFNLDESLLKPAGSKVRCSKCKAIFTAFPSEPQAVNDTTNKDSDFSLPEIEDEQNLNVSDLEKMLQTDIDVEDEDLESDDLKPDLDESPKAVESDKIDAGKPSDTSETNVCL
jgi:predicted Zn finger-like uncharacterized protein